MLRVQLLTAMRPGEICAMRGAEIQTDSLAENGTMRGLARGTGCSVWIYSPQQWKCAYRGLTRTILLGPQAQRLIAPLMNDGFIFRNRCGEPYSVNGYYQQVRKACRRAGVPTFGPGAVRHLAATIIRQQYGLEAAQVILGHRSLTTTQVYAARHEELGLRVAAEIG